MNPKQDAMQKQAQTLIKQLDKRNMKGHYFASAEECKAYVLNLIPTSASVANGGSMTIIDMGLLDAVKTGPYNYIDRMSEPYSKVVDADYFLMSTNAITQEGELVNIDGAGNRVASLIYGPKNVLVIAGMNKVVTDIPDAFHRVRNIASPANTTRLNRHTPCEKTGQCEDCLSNDCICNQFVITRRSGIKDRIKVLLIGEELGY